MEFLHVDRWKKIYEGQTLDLIKYNDIMPEYLQYHANNLFPDGVSNWGEINLLRNLPFCEDKSHSKDYVLAIELIFEYVRRAFFPDKTSRYQSFFGFINYEDVKNYGHEFDRHRDIWIVETDNYFIDDGSWLCFGTSLYVSYCAHQYWSGAMSDKHKREVLMSTPIRVIRRYNQK